MSLSLPAYILPAYGGRSPHPVLPDPALLIRGMIFVGAWQCHAPTVRHL
ncbi:MAG: hypothetical protein VKL39_12170 [Leptolyngbyaceae bacterium]|nr:hypothetical protein [Leptolyngbyaceae bacterium]